MLRNLKASEIKMERCSAGDGEEGDQHWDGEREKGSERGRSRGMIPLNPPDTRADTLAQRG